MSSAGPGKWIACGSCDMLVTSSAESFFFDLISVQNRNDNKIFRKERQKL